MRKFSLKNDRPDRIKSLAFSPMMSALAEVFRSPKSSAEVATSKEVVAPTPLIQARAIRFEALEPRVLLSGDVNPAALTISGAISAPGEQDHYEFTVEEPRRVVFDSLTNSTDLSWKLDGPSGQVTNRTFAQTDYYGASPAFELAPGKYQIIIPYF